MTILSKLATLFLFCSLPLFAQHITYTKKQHKNPRLIVHHFKVNPRRIEIELVNGNDACLGIETVSSMAARKKSILAVNGSYFQGGRMLGAPDGPFKMDGLACGFRGHPTGALAWYKKKRIAYIDRVTSHAELIVGGRHIKLDGVNRNLYPTGKIGYTSNFHSCTMTPEGSTDYLVENGSLQRRQTGYNSAHIPYKGFVYSEGNKVSPPLPGHLTGKKAKLSLQYSPLFRPDQKELFNNCPNMIHGTILLISGHIITDYAKEKVNPALANKRHGRTAVGIDANGWWHIMIIEGRSKNSIGVTLKELAKLMKKKGCHSALALDGGGSSTFIYKGKAEHFQTHTRHPFSQQNIFYHPDGGERPIGNCLIFKSKDIR